MANPKYNTGSPNINTKKLKQNKFFLAVVVETGNSIIVENAKKTIRTETNKIYNSDPYLIKCRIYGFENDNHISSAGDLINCYPLLPKHIAKIPKVGDAVFILSDAIQESRYYIGPIISTLNKLEKETWLEGALSTQIFGTTAYPLDITKLEEAHGIYSEYDEGNTYQIDSGYNSDIVFKDNEVLIRSGKFVIGNPLLFNEYNPSYIQMKNDFTYENQTWAVTNIVSEKINLLTHGSGFNLSKRDMDGNTTPYIDDDELKNIIENAHPIVYGDLLVHYLRLLKNAFINHVHNGSGNKPTDLTTGPILPLEVFLKESQRLEEDMLSTQIKAS